MIYMWSQDYPQNQIKRELNIPDESTHVLIDWANFMREVCEQNLEENPFELGGFHEDGSSIIVEIDESKYFHRKYHRGQWREGHRIFGAIERHTGSCCLAEVPNRRKETLIPIIQRWILPGTRIVSDGWAAYADIEEIQGGIYRHDVEVHQDNFVDPVDATVHTHNIENTWFRSKRKLRRQCGTSQELFPSYLAEFLWRNRFPKRHHFAEFIACVKDIYNV